MLNGTHRIAIIPIVITHVVITTIEVEVTTILNIVQSTNPVVPVCTLIVELRTIEIASLFVLSPNTTNNKVHLRKSLLILTFFSDIVFISDGQSMNLPPKIINTQRNLLNH
jgi:hypothetical protein